jgi:hypothetical protein
VKSWCAPIAAAVFALAAGCATGSAAMPRAQSASECESAADYRMPAWAEPARETRDASPRGVTVARDEEPTPDVPLARTVRLIPDAQRDPVDAVLTGRGGRRRLGALNLRRAPVDETLRMFATVGRFNLVFTDDVAGRQVTLDLRDVSVDQAFRAVLAAAHLDVDVVAGNVLAVRAAHAPP